MICFDENRWEWKKKKRRDIRRNGFWEWHEMKVLVRYIQNFSDSLTENKEWQSNPWLIFVLLRPQVDRNYHLCSTSTNKNNIEQQKRERDGDGDEEVGIGWFCFFLPCCQCQWAPFWLAVQRVLDHQIPLTFSIKPHSWSSLRCEPCLSLYSTLPALSNPQLVKLDSLLQKLSSPKSYKSALPSPSSDSLHIIPLKQQFLF